MASTLAPDSLFEVTKQVENEGVSINSLVTEIIAEAIGARQTTSQKRRSVFHLTPGLNPR